VLQIRTDAQQKLLFELIIIHSGVVWYKTHPEALNVLTCCTCRKCSVQFKKNVLQQWIGMRSSRDVLVSLV